MKTYPLEVTIAVDVPAPSLEDAIQSVEDILGPGELEDFDITVKDFIIKER